MTTFRNIFYTTTENRFNLFWRLLFLIVLTISLILLGDLLIVRSISLLFGQEIITEPTTITGLVTLLNTPFALGGAALIATRFFDKRSFTRYGLRLNKQLIMQFVMGVLLGGVIAGGIIIVQWAAGWIRLSEMFYGGEFGRFLPLLLNAILLHLVTAIGEELLFRGYLMPNIGASINQRLKNPRLSMWAALALVSVLFGLIHILNTDGTLTYAINTILSGSIVLGVGYLLTGSIALPIGLHAAYNLCQDNIFVLDESAPAVLRFIQTGGPTLLTGGELGFDGSLLTIVMALSVTIALVLWVQRRKGASMIHDNVVSEFSE